MKWLTISWDNDQLLLVTARNRGNKVVYDRAIAVSLRMSPDGSHKSESSMYISAVTPADIARESQRQETERRAADELSPSPLSAVLSPLTHPVLLTRLKSIIQHENLTGAATIVVLGRASTEIRTLSFPPVPEEELPEMARFQAAREFGSYEPNSPLDFFLIDEHPANGNVRGDGKSQDTKTSNGRASDGRVSDAKTDGKNSAENRRRVIAATVKPTLLSDIEQLCDEAGLHLRRVVLRPCELASFWTMQPDFLSSKTYLLVELDYREASLTIVHEGIPVFMRAAKLPNGPYSVLQTAESDSTATSNKVQIAAKQEVSSQLVAEIKRTLVAASNEWRGDTSVKVDTVVLWGDAPHHQDVGRLLSESLNLQVETFAPWAGIECGGELRNGLPPAAERFASLVASLAVATKPLSSLVDFLNPKRKPEPKGKKRILAAIAIAAAVFLVSLLGYGYLRKQAFATELSLESKQTAELKQSAENADVLRKQFLAVQKWENGSVNWLEQLYWLSVKLPESDKVLLNSLTCRNDATSPAVAGTMTFQILAKNAATLGPMEEGLRDTTHQVKGGNKMDDSTKSGYTVKSDINVIIGNEKR